jgi:PII-like signaling protein
VTAAGDVSIARIYLSEADHGRRKSLMREVIAILHEQHKLRGVTVFRGIAGYGESGELHNAADMLTMMVDLPLVIEFFDTPEKVEAALTAVAGLVPAGHILSWRATSR